MCGTSITADLRAKIDAVDAADRAAVLKRGVDFAVAQCRGLLHAGVAGLHFYTMNRDGSTRAIINALKAEELL